MNKRSKPILYLVIPAFNEEQVLPITTEELTKKLNKLIKDKIINKDSKIMYVDDGSVDKTWELIQEYHKNNKLVNGLKLSRNKGHQNALLAGLLTSKNYSDVTISMDADLQDDINVIDDMLKEYANGSEIVYGVRSSRKKDSFFKKDYPYVYEFDSPIEFDDLINSVIKDDNEKKLIPPVTVGVFKLKNYTSEQNLPETIYNF